MTSEVALLIGPGVVHGPDSELVANAAGFGVGLDTITELAIVHLRGVLTQESLQLIAERLLVDPVIGWCRDAAIPTSDGPTSDGSTNDGPTSDVGGTITIETGLRPGVTDRQGAELMRAARSLNIDLTAATIGRRWIVTLAESLDPTQIDVLAHRVLHNEVIERFAVGPLAPGFVADEGAPPPTQQILIGEADEDDLERLSQARRLGLNLAEMQAVQDYFFHAGRPATDGELEMIAQTWSEHCAHKTFRAAIEVRDANGQVVDQIDGLLKSCLRAATEAIDAPWVHSAFVDNAGLVAFDDTFDIALKAETHNHPSALEPFGGANTGVGGVVRDIIGVSAKPIAITDILCFGPADLDPHQLPAGVLHPRRVRDGVIAGVGDYGNKIGVPNVGGAIVYDDAYTTTPLVFAGCVGLLPTGSHRTDPQPGDAIVVIGGAVGRDGVGGATFSSQTMQAETADIAGSSVQIGDPIVEKGLIDVVLEARDGGLYTAITDCGAGGLSSSVGEMGAVIGAWVDLQLVPRKYAGLAPWEVWLSEAQERMVLAAADPQPLLDLAARWGVDAAVIGRFTDDKRIVVVNGNEPVIDLDCTFLHDGCPRLELVANVPDTARPERTPVTMSHKDALLALLAHPTIASKEAVVRTYDHEIMGAMVTRPFGGPEGDGAGDGAAMIPPGTSGENAMAIGIGVNAVIGTIDAAAMAWTVVDEAVRNAVLAGVDPHQLSLLDNFAWGNPNDPATLGQLVAACQACRDAALAFGAPFVSGKDSLYNVFVGPDGVPDPVAPTLVITAVGIARKPDNVPLIGAVEPGNEVWLVGPATGSLGGSHLDQIAGYDHGGEVPGFDAGAVARHHEVAAAIDSALVVSGHDLAEGGLAVAAAEWAFAGRRGLQLVCDDNEATLFGEGSARYLLEVRPDDAERFAATVPSAARIGTVTTGSEVAIGSLHVSLEAVQQAWIQPARKRRADTQHTEVATR